VRAGKLAGDLPTLEAIRSHCAAHLASLPEHLRRLDAKGDYPVSYSDQLEADAKKLMEQGG
jgi:nicotinate phosphoribosyltransferase